MPDAAPGAGKDRGRRSGKRTRPDPNRPGALPDGNKNAPAGRQPHKGQRKIKNKTSINPKKIESNGRKKKMIKTENGMAETKGKLSEINADLTVILMSFRECAAEDIGKRRLMP